MNLLSLTLSKKKCQLYDDDDDKDVFNHCISVLDESLSLSLSLSNLKISKSLPLRKTKNETEFYDNMFSSDDEVAIATITTTILDIKSTKINIFFI